VKPVSPDVRARAHPGFVLPLALFALLGTALLVAILLQGAVQEVRLARGEVAGSRAQAAAGSALADFLASLPDSTLLARSRGSVTVSSAMAGPESTRVSMQLLGNRMLRVTAGARAWSGGVRGDASSVGFVRIVARPFGPPGSLQYQRLPGWWWAQLP
jgi:Tfp pilus assembly protein PilX